MTKLFQISHEANIPNLAVIYEDDKKTKPKN